MTFCTFHLRYNVERKATRELEGEHFCSDCWQGKPITESQMQGLPTLGRPPKVPKRVATRTKEEKAAFERQRKINYYYANRLTILQKKARQRGGHTRAI